MSDEKCIKRVVGAVMDVAGGSLVAADHHEWRYYVNPNGDGFYCVFCLALRPFAAARTTEGRE